MNFNQKKTASSNSRKVQPNFKKSHDNVAEQNTQRVHVSPRFFNIYTRTRKNIFGG